MTDNRNTERLQKDERNIAALVPTRITKGPLRDCVLPEYTGDSDEHFLGGMVTGDEAFELFKAHYESLGHGNNVEVFSVSPAEVFTKSGRKTVWLPDVFGFSQAAKKLKVEIVHRDREIAQLRSSLSDVRFDLRAAEEIIKKLESEAVNAETLKLSIAASTPLQEFSYQEQCDRERETQAKEKLLQLLRSRKYKPWWRFW